MTDGEAHEGAVIRPPRHPSSIAPGGSNSTSHFAADLLRESGPNATWISKLISTLESMRGEIVQEFRRRTEELTTSMQCNCGTRPGTLNSRSTVRTRGSSGNEAESGTRKRALPDPGDVMDVKLMATREYAWLPIIRLIMMYTILSFSKTYGATRRWLAGRKRENLAHVEQLCEGGVSGLSLIYFSVASDDLKSRHSCALGKACSSLCTDFIVSIMMSARQDFFGATNTAADDSPGGRENRPIPDCLKSFGGKREATLFVQGVVEQLERTNQLPIQRERSKRVRPSVVASAPVRASEEPLRPYREIAIRTIRTAVLRAMSDGKTAARLHLYRSFLFVVEEVARYSNPSCSVSAGLEVILSNPESDEERDVPGVLDGTVWDIDVAEKGENGYQVNKEALDRLGVLFPSLSLTLKYRRKFVGVPAYVQVSDAITVGNDDPGNETSAGAEGELFFDVEEVVSLHTIATGLLVETYKMQTHKVVLGASELSLRTIHIMAIGLRGLILKVLKKELSELEVAALGAIEHRYLNKDDVIATVIVGNRKDTESVRKVLEKERVFKFSMPYSEYCARKRVQENERAEAARREASIRSIAENSADAQHCVAETEADYGISWMA